MGVTMDDTITPAPAEPEQEAPQTDATTPVEETFRWSAEVNVPEDCPGCNDPEHFHAWCRIPNQWQHDDIREKALAAKARRLRQLHDVDSDSRVILEADLAELQRADARWEMTEELIAQDWWKHHLEALRDVQEREEFKHIDADRDRLAEIDRLPVDQRPAEERTELQRHLDQFDMAIKARRDELEAPRRSSLEALSLEELVDQVRQSRIAGEASAAFMTTYQKWQIFSGTFTPDRKTRTFDRIEALDLASPAVIEALQATYTDLQRALHRGPAGNS